MAFDIFLCAVYAVLVVLVTSPKGEKKEHRKARLLWPFLSTFFLPWSGESFLFFTGLDSRWWFAAIAAAFVFSNPGARRAALFMCLAYTAVTVGVLDRFTLTVGVPGALSDLGSLSMVLRLASLANASLFAAMAFFFTGLALSFAGGWESTFVSRFSSATAFSFSGFLTIVFVPFDATALWGAEPWLAALVNPAVLFLTAALLSRFLLKGTPLPPKARWLVPPACIAAGCYFINSSI